MMMNLSSVMIGTMQVQAMSEFYKGVLGEPTMVDGTMTGWMAGGAFFSVMEHSEMGGPSKEPGRIMFNLDAADVKAEFERIKGLGAAVIKEPYDAGRDMWIATLADPDGNYFQLMTPWSADDLS
jgi:predicted enzyme related to lactoylglutathione lyase